VFSNMTFQEFEALSEKGARVAVYKRIPADTITPISVYRALAEKGKRSFILDSAEREGDTGRYSFLGFNPFLHLQATGCDVTEIEGSQEKNYNKDPRVALRELFEKYRTVPQENLPPFTGGAIGFFSYDTVRLQESIPDRHPKEDSIPDIAFSFYDSCIAFDHQTKVATVFQIVDLIGDSRAVFDKGMEKIESLLENISKSNPAIISRPKSESIEQNSEEVKVDIGDEEFIGMVERAQQYIREGDIFQVVLSRRFQKKTTAEPFDIYRALRIACPSPYLFFLQDLDFSVAGASPEKLIAIQDKLITCNPLAGTRPRRSGEEQARIEEDLLNDPKEKAEHVMLVDLGRNDVGAVATPGSVYVKSFMNLQRLSHVTHISSEITGKLRDGLDSIDGIKSSLPAGTLSGAPKVRAMEIIDELETSKRGLYGGGICYIDNQGNVDSCIAIRMAVIRDGVATVRTGAGVVLDSIPRKEADETRYKAAGVLQAIKLAEEGLLC
jgi:anthranilate synthase component 1